jgi:CDP-diacylglycerol pyrophosphatase
MSTCSSRYHRISLQSESLVRSFREGLSQETGLDEDHWRERDSLAHVDPFKLLARGLPSGKFAMRSQTLAVIGATFADGRTGFYLLANDSGASPRKIVGAEALLDDKCAD